MIICVQDLFYVFLYSRIIIIIETKTIKLLIKYKKQYFISTSWFSFRLTWWTEKKNTKIKTI